jgi:DNA-binding transcriptional LysR family regulator
MNIDDLNLCLRVAAIGNISEVARQLSVTPQAASAAISRVEKSLMLVCLSVQRER